MCGLAGYFETRPDAVNPQEALSRLRSMTVAIAHRGPDDEDIFVDGPVGLAHRRLAVIDPAPHGRQPMHRGSLSISYNGEIYNYRELRSELEGIGEVFRTGTDTEVLLAAFHRWGERAFHRFNGMFALALWDRATRRLTLARDRIGEKPLYYALHNDILLFGSEIKAILAWPGFPHRANLEAIHHYLSLQYVPAPLTAFETVHTLRAGSILTIGTDQALSIKQYWCPPMPRADIELTPSEVRDAEQQTRELLAAAVQRRMVADVPIGAFLSGGIDSSAVCALMARAQDKPIKTFSIGFEESDFDERQFARLVARSIGAEHYEDVVRVDAAAILDDLVWHYGQPFADPSAIPTFVVSRLAGQHVTVVLTGDGGDEFFLGYERYRDFSVLGRFEHWPNIVKTGALRFAGAISPQMADRRPFGGLKRRLSAIGASRAERYALAMLYFQEADKQLGYGDAMRSCLNVSSLDILSPFLDGIPSLVAGAAWADSQTYLPDDLMVKVDVATMAFGLEARAPFLDVTVMQHAQNLPPSLKFSNGVLKSHLKQALNGLLPNAVIHRPKMGFGVPIETWFRGDLSAVITDLFASQAARTRGIFADGYINRLLREHVSYKRQHHTRLWAALMLELWFCEWIDG